MRAAFATLLTSMMLIPAIAAAQNTPPVADAGPDQDIFVGEATLLEGSATDPDGHTIVGWQWSVVSAPAGSSPFISDPTRPDPFFIADVEGDYVLSLIASDLGSSSAPDTVLIHAAELLPPVAVIVADLAAGVVPFTVSFDGSQSVDNVGDGLTYNWTFGDGSAPSAEASPTHEYVAAGTFTVRLAVVDSYGQSDSDTLLIAAALPTNAPPTVNPTATPNNGQSPLVVEFSAGASDPDGDELTFTWDFGDGGTSVEADPTHTFTNSGTYIVWLTVSDGQDEATASLTIVVDDPIDVLVQKARVGIKADLTGKVTLVADFTASVPEIDDEVLVTFDGIVLFSAPLSEFTLVRADEFNPGDGSGLVLKLKADDLRVKLDLSKGSIRVKAKYLDVSTLDNSNGVDVELRIGNGAGLENILMSEGSRGLRYRAE